MTSIRNAGTSASPEVVQPAGQFPESTSEDDPLARLVALLPTTGHLDALASGTGVMSRIPPGLKAGKHVKGFEVSEALLSPLEALPPFVALDAVRRRASAAETTTD